MRQNSFGGLCVDLSVVLPPPQKKSLTHPWKLSLMLAVTSSIQTCPELSLSKRRKTADANLGEEKAL